MKENELTGLFNGHPVLSALTEAVRANTATRLNAEGLSGSAKAIALAGVYLKTALTHLVIVPEKEDAAYLYNDL
ncbi:MAG: hypothetical protein GT598_06265, partial [Bacteroidales bacterium]|nr:hypothetical protein [Bacteroidales bacterium]